MTHETTVKLDHQRGGWVARCSCGWEARLPSWYEERAFRYAQAHVKAASA